MNTQIMKVTALPGSELTNKPGMRYREFLFGSVTTKYSYVIGGNADREFSRLNNISKHNRATWVNATPTTC